jgi:hypothetical protein
MDPTLYAEYRSGLAAMGRVEWTALKDKLCGNNSAETLALFKDYVAAWLERQRADEELDEFAGYAGPDTRRLAENYAEQTRLMNVSHYALRTERQTYYDLSVALLGDGVFWADPADDSDDETEEWNYEDETDDN